MAYAEEDVVVGINAALYSVPSGTVVSDLTVPAEAVHYGWTSVEGITLTPESTNTPITMNGGDVPRILKREGSVKIKAILTETNKKVLDLAIGGTVVNGVRKWDPQRRLRFTGFVDGLDYVDEFADDVETFIRYFIPNGEITALDEIVLKDDQEVRWGVEITAYRTNGRCIDIITPTEVTP